MANLTRTQLAAMTPKCCAFLASKPGVLCTNKGKYVVVDLVFCGKHIKAGRKSEQEYEIAKCDRVMNTLSIYTNLEKPVCDDDECCVCCAPLDDPKDRVFLGCGHTYHKECIAKWFATDKNTCPYCRTKSDIGKINPVSDDVLKMIFNLAIRYKSPGIATAARSWAQNFKMGLLINDDKEKNISLTQNIFENLEDIRKLFIERAIPVMF